MTHNVTPNNAIPYWFLHAVRVMQDTDRSVRHIDIELRHAMGRNDLDDRLHAEMQLVRDSLGAVKVSLSVSDMRAEEVLRDIAANDPTGLKQAAGT